MSESPLINRTGLILGIITLLCAAFLYRHAFTSYFFQDDWFTFRISRVTGISDFFNFFVPRNDVIYFRPFGMQIPFFLMNQIWGINGIPYRLLTFSTHMANTVLIYLLFRKLIGNRFFSWLGAFLYGTSVVSLIPFFWFATYSFILCVTFFFLSSLLLLRFMESKKYLLLFLSFILFTTGLLTNELVASLPVIWSLFLLLTKKFKMIRYLIPYYILTIMLVILRFVWFSPPTHGLYRMELGWHIITNLKTYIFWTFNWYEILTDQMIKPFVFSFWVMDYYPGFAYMSVTGTIVLWVLLILCIYSILKNKTLKYGRLILFGVCWYPIALMPVLLFNQHKFPYYLPIALTGFLLFFMMILKSVYDKLKLKRLFWFKIIILTVLIAWFGIAAVTEEYFYLDHWAPRRAKLADNVINEQKVNRVKLHSSPVTIEVPDTSEMRLALNGEDAGKVIFGDDTRTIYSQSGGTE